MANFRHILLKETDSTNRQLKLLCDQEVLEEFTTLSADFQTAGKGQRGNFWESERGKNIMLSTVLYPTFLKCHEQFILSQITALAIKEILTDLTDEISIKWPNDIYWRDKKICGILIEHDLSGTCLARTIVGIGLNINQTKFVSNAPNPISLATVTGQEQDRIAVLDRIIERIIYYYNLLRSEVENGGLSYAAQAIRSRYADALYRGDGYYPFIDSKGPFAAKIINVNNEGVLTLEDTEGVRREYLFKEVQYVL